MLVPRAGHRKESTVETTRTAVDIGRDALEAYNDGDRKVFGEMLADNVTYTEVAFNKELKGREETLTYVFDEYRTAFPDFYGRIVDTLPGEHKIGFEMIWTGTHLGDFVTPVGTFKPTGRQFTSPTFMVFTINNGKITSIVHYFDSATTLMQLGLIPEPFVVPA